MAEKLKEMIMERFIFEGDYNEDLEFERDMAVDSFDLITLAADISSAFDIEFKAYEWESIVNIKQLEQRIIEKQKTI